MCGNDMIESDEQCDPPNGTTCGASCRRIQPNCGNGVVDPGEECDDGNQVWGDACFECSARHYFILNNPVDM